MNQPTATLTQTNTPLIYKILVLITMMTLVGGSLTALMTYINLGYSDNFFTDWSSSFLVAVPMMPIGFMLMGLITRVVEKGMPDSEDKKRNLVIGTIMACIMESLLAFATAINNIGFDHYGQLFDAWLSAFVAALPLGLTIMVIISMTIKPKLEQFLNS